MSSNYHGRCDAHGVMHVAFTARGWPELAHTYSTNSQVASK